MEKGGNAKVGLDHGKTTSIPVDGLMSFLDASIRHASLAEQARKAREVLDSLMEKSNGVLYPSDGFVFRISLTPSFSRRKYEHIEGEAPEIKYGRIPNSRSSEHRTILADRVAVIGEEILAFGLPESIGHSGEVKRELTELFEIDMLGGINEVPDASRSTES